MIPSAHINPKKIVEAVHHLLDDHSFHDRATDVMKLSSGLDGIDNIVNIIRPYLK